MFLGWQWIVFLTILAIMYIFSPNEDKNYEDYDCYDKSLYKCGKCKKNCKWKYIVKKFEELEKEEK